MKLPRVLFVALALAGCSDPTGPGVGIDGTWVAYQVESSTTLTLHRDGGAVTGTGTYFRNINPPSGAIEVSGTLFRDHLSLTLRYDTGVTTQFSAEVKRSGKLSGTETFPGGWKASLTFVRQVD